MAEQAKPYEILREGNEEVMRIDANNWPHAPSIEDNSNVMVSTIEKLLESPNVSRVIFNQKRNYSYDFDQTQGLLEIAMIYQHLMKQKKILSIESLGFDENEMKFFSEKLGTMQYVVMNLLRSDPIGAFVEVKRLIREEAIKFNSDHSEAREKYINNLKYIHNLLESTRIISFVKDRLEGYEIGDRSLYKEIFKPTITPDFMYTRVMAMQPLNGEQIDAYSVGRAEVSIFNTPNDIKKLYHIIPPEFKLTEDKYELLDLARNILAEHKPKEEEFLDPEKMRATFYNIGKDLIEELAEHKNINLEYSEIQEMAEILVRYTVGFGLIEVLLQDDKIQDITINGPIGETRIFIVHQEHDECVTNIIPARDDGLSWASKFRLLSGRPLDEANPVLDTELTIPGARARVAIMSRPLSPNGLAFAIRRHRDKPWTLPLFMQKGMISAMGAGLLSFLIDGSRTLLFAGTRSSGKTSLLGSSLVEIMRKHRIISIEDTLELPIESLRKIGYNVQPMKVRAALTTGGGEITADEGVRTSLRLGDSCLIVGEIRSVEAKALYEAMRVGALANVVAGTIHGADPYGVYDRVVNDLGVPKTSFKATDIIIVSNPIKTADGMHSKRRVTQIAEVRKHWETDPLKEKGFMDLMTYNTKTDLLEPTQDLINGDSEVLKSIAGNVPEWAGNWDAVWENIMLRAKIKETLVNYSTKSNNLEILEAPFVVLSNDTFHKICDIVKEETGSIDAKEVYREWHNWLKRQVKQISF